ncbi:hypothetical protein C3737_12635 [Aeromonas jandaei]|uniref:ANR family transcriptional regulator n=1 Tax=Aeromonas jandaei TaxID=650 RepID=UPI000CE1C66C|nr:ANR family transcriptional regulator [Aeromonas jandaei]PPA30444.1 hypothetical protein C3737_12635 [Aeromonas jandaei]
MRKPFNPKGFAALSQRAIRHEENGEWLKGAQVWKLAIRAAKTSSEWFTANARRDFCLRNIPTVSTTQQEAV